MKPTHLLLIFIFCILLISLFTFLPLSTYAEQPGLVTCGLMGGANVCNICDLITLFQTLVSKANAYFALPLAALMLGYGGFLMVLSGFQGGNAGLFTKGKTVLTNAIVGIVIIFCSWIAIDTLLKTIGAYQHAPSSNFGPWNVITCISPVVKYPKHFACKDDDTCGEVDGYSIAGCTEARNCGANAEHLGCKDSTCQWIKEKGTNNCIEGEDPRCNTKYHKCLGTSCVEAEGTQRDECIVLGPDNPSCKTAVGYEGNADNAKKLEGRVHFSGDADCNGKSAQTNFQELLNKESLTVCHHDCRADKTPCIQQDFTANGRMLVDVINLIDKFDFKGISVSSISTGDHTSNSAHYKGQAIDIQSLDKTKYKDLRNQLRSFNPDSPYLECEGDSGVIKDCGAGTNHVHVTYP